MAKSHKCTAMMLFNLAEPDWISVPCNQSLLSNILCYHKEVENKSYRQRESITDYSYCLSDHLITHQICHCFIWFNANITANPYKMYAAKPKNIKTIQNWKHLINAISLTNDYPSLLIENNMTTISVITLQRILEKLHYRNETASICKARGFNACYYNKYGLSIRPHMFHCRKGGYISSEYTCDSIIDCPNDKCDEEFCICYRPLRNQAFNESKICKTIFFGKKKNGLFNPLLYDHNRSL